MASKAARKKRRLEQERQRLAGLEARGVAHTRCSDVTLAELDVLLAQADELLGRIGTHVARARTAWPQVPAAYELRATVEEIAAAAASGRAKLAVALERSRRFQRSGVHVHLCGDLAVRMVPLAAQSSAPASAPLDVDDEHAYGGDGFGTPCSDDIPF
ncbi:MAG: hypothetical protein E6J90_49130 [Deltaproteobacteria bacterium]|nr:MAG: hypothetical protein E6J90_49130 [Deltaproteobacteria bacterium]TMQ19603.1 MAG: hypothetical protein E6J91_05935 [Deltaproteobacteria bacterium]